MFLTIECNRDTKLKKWELIAHIGIYLKWSPKHTYSITLVLKPCTGLVSSQFHLKFNDLFEIVCGKSNNSYSKWQQFGCFTPGQLELTVMQTITLLKPKPVELPSDHNRYHNNSAPVIQGTGTQQTHPKSWSQPRTSNLLWPWSTITTKTITYYHTSNKHCSK